MLRLIKLAGITSSYKEVIIWFFLSHFRINYKNKSFFFSWFSAIWSDGYYFRGQSTKEKQKHYFLIFRSQECGILQTWCRWCSGVIGTSSNQLVTQVRVYFFFTWMFCLTCLVKHRSGFFMSGPLFSWSHLQGRECLPHSVRQGAFQPWMLWPQQRHESPSHAAQPVTRHSGQRGPSEHLLMQTVLLGVTGIVVVMYPLSTRYIYL